MEFKGYILNYLLDKYEKSSHYKGDAKANKKIALVFSPKTMPWYYEIEQPHLKKAIQGVIEELATSDIVSYQWLPFEKGNLLERVWLNLEQLELAYKIAGRRPKRQKVQELAREIVKLLPEIKLGWIINYLEDCLSELKEQEEVPALLPQLEEERKLLFKAFKGLEDKQDEVMLERVFSIKYLGHSKLFQREARGRLAKIAGRYYQRDASIVELTEDELILELGLEKNSEEILVWGPIIFSYHDKLLDYGQFPFGGVIDTKYMQQLQIAAVEAENIVTIENKANFHELVNRKLTNSQQTNNPFHNKLVGSQLFIYIGGFPGPKKRSFLASLYQLYPTASFYHWGDIDLGGFRIFTAIKGVIPIIAPLLMDEETLLAHREYCDDLEVSYARQLEKLLVNREYEFFWPVIRQMLKEGIRLEQEALLV